MKKYLFSLLFLSFLPCSFSLLKANELVEIKQVLFSVPDSLLITTDSNLVQVLLLPTDSVKQNNGTLKNDNVKKKIVSAFFAFPFPFGFMGAHRVMLGTKPWVPIIYAATFGGCFGILPLIDFCVIVFSKDIEQYENNPKVFMWMK